MAAYILRRLGLMIPTLFGIILINFAVVQFLPGGPIEQLLAEARGEGNVTARFTGESQGEARGPQAQTDGGSSTSRYRGAQGVDPAFIRELEVQFGFDRPAPERFLKMLGDYLTFDFGRSWFRDKSVLALIAEKMPVSISLGLWTTLITYLIAIPLGIRKAVRDGSRFDTATSAAAGIPARGYAFGSRTTNLAPITLPSSPFRFSASMVPRSAPTIWRLMESPRPECCPKRSPRGRSE